MKKKELLIPVGNIECLHAAIHNGADAVYLGGKRFGARAYSNNFDKEEMVKSIKLCHLYGVKVYVTVNTMIFNEEINSVIEYINFLYENNVDALIMQDIGLITLVRKLFPKLDIHISTQAHNHNEPGINYFKNIGCTRVVFDRESSLEEINNIKTDIEKEVFVYGALCICYSGNCLFSALNGGRSANRGMCVGSCRMPYTLKINNEIKDKGYLLSTKDLNTTNKINEILNSNIDSLKVEGRMKSKEYVALVTKTYRRLIDSYYNQNFKPITEEEQTNLLKVYNREFTLGYLMNEPNIINKKTSNHQGIKVGKIISGNNKQITIEATENIHQQDAIRIEGTNIGMYLNTIYNKNGLLVSNIKKGEIFKIDNKDRILVKEYIGKNILKTIDYLLSKEILNYQEKKININILFRGKINEKALIEINDNINKVSIEGPIIEQALTQGMTKDRIKIQLEKLGNTPFKANKIEIDIEDNIFINIKELNEMRRIATDSLANIRTSHKRVHNNIELKEPISKKTKVKLSILVRNEDQLKIALKNNIDLIYVTDENLYTKYKTYKNIYLRLDRVIKHHKEYKNENLLCTEFGSIIKYKDNNKIIADYYLNIANDYSINTLSNLNTIHSCLSVELKEQSLNNIKNKADSEIIIYGYPECMIIKNDIFNCQNKDKAYLINDQSDHYKILTYNNYTHIFNKEPINKLNNIKNYLEFKYIRIELLDEDEIKIQSIINKIKDMI